MFIGLGPGWKAPRPGKFPRRVWPLNLRQARRLSYVCLADRNVLYSAPMHFFVQRSELRDLYDKAAAGEGISWADLAGD